MWVVLHKVVAVNEWHGQILQVLDMDCPSVVPHYKVGYTHVT